MLLHQDIWKRAHQGFPGLLKGKVSVGGGVVLLLLVATVGVNVAFNTSHVGAQSAAVCSGGERSYMVRQGDTLGTIAQSQGSNWSALATRNSLANPNLIFSGQRLCIPGPNAVTSNKTQNSTLVNQNANSRPATSSVEGMIMQVFGPHGPAAVRVAKCESGLNPAASNSISIGGSHASGVFQILYPSTWRGTSQSAKSPYDAWSNISAAHEIFARDGNSWRQWSCKP